MSLSKLLGKPAPFTFEGETYMVSPWNYDIQAAFEKYFQAKAWENLRKLAASFSNEEYKEERSSLRRDIDSGKYDFGNELIQSALDIPKHQKELVYLSLLYSNKDKLIDRDLVEKIWDDQEAHRELMEVIREVNSDPNQKRPTKKIENTDSPVKD